MSNSTPKQPQPDRVWRLMDGFVLIVALMYLALIGYVIYMTHGAAL